MESASARPKDAFKDALKAKGLQHQPCFMERTACGRSKWRLIVRNGAKSCEASRTAAVEDRRQLRKSTNKSPSTAYIPGPR